MHDLRGSYILSLNKPRKTSHGLNYFSYISAKLRNALSDFIRTTELLVLKEGQGPYFVQRLFSLINISLNIVYLVMYLYMLCVLALNVMPGSY